MYEYNNMYEYNDEDGGIQFQPYDDQLINFYLIPKLQGKPCREITTKDVYSKEPWLLDHPMGSFFKKNEWYYFVTRTQLSKKKIGCGKKAKRMITRDDDSGSWKANAKDEIRDKETNMVIGEKKTLAFVTSNVNNKKKQKMGDGTSCDVVVPGSESSWIMTEYMLPEIDDKFRELVICKIHVIENSDKEKKDDRHEASTSSYHHQHESALASSFSDQQLQHPINEPHHQHESALASSFSDQQLQHPINEPHYQHASAPASSFSDQQLQHQDHEASTYLHHIYSSTSEQQPINIFDHGTLLAPNLEQQRINLYDDLASLSFERQTMNLYDDLASLSFEQQPMNLYDDLASLSFEEEPTNVTSKIQENNKKDDHEAFTPHHYEFLADSSTKQQPVNEAHGHVPEIPLIGSENNDQVVFEAFRQVSEKDTQLYIDAPLEEEGGEWIQRLRNSLTRMNTSSMPMEEDVDMIYDTSLIDQDLVDQYATLRPQESFKL
ncbi:hypothetical protein Bca4012_011344 [Brassica carinata]